MTNRYTSDRSFSKRLVRLSEMQADCINWQACIAKRCYRVAEYVISGS